MIIVGKTEEKNSYETMKKAGIGLHSKTQPEGLSISVTGRSLWLKDINHTRIMYGGFEFAEIIESGRIKKVVKDQVKNTILKVWGT